MNNALKILMLEDSAADAEMIQRLLKRQYSGCQIKLEMTEEAYISALNEFKPDIVISDNEMPQFSAAEALSILHQRTHFIPFILVTGTVSEEFAVEIIKSGADDYILKDRLTRLPAAIDVALKQKKTEKEKLDAAEKLREEKDKFSKIAATSPGLIYSMRQDKNGNFSFPYSSDAVNDIYGFAFNEIENNPEKIFSLIHPEDLKLLLQKISVSKNNMVPLHCEYRYMHPVKGLLWHEMDSLPVAEPDGSVICHGIAIDITERKNAEKKLLKANRLYSFISQINQMIVRTTDENTLYEEVCRIAVEIGQFSMAWIGIAEETKKIVPVMQAGDKTGYLNKIKPVNIEDATGAWGPTGRAFRDGKYCFCNDIEEEPSMLPWQQEAIALKYFSCMALPIKKFDAVISVLTVYAPEKDFFDSSEVALLEEATRDVSFAMEFFEKEYLRKKAEEAVIASEERYHRLTEVAPVGIFHTNAAGYTTYVNPTWCTISCMSPEQALGYQWLNAVHPDDRKLLLKGWDQATSLNKSSRSEYRFIHQDGSIVWVMGQAIPEKNSENQVTGYVGAITDITERKKAEESILLSNERYNLVSKATNDSIWDFDLVSGKIVRLGNGFKLLFGYDAVKDEYDNLHWMKLIHQEDLADVEGSIQKAINKPGETNWEAEYRFLKADGQYAAVYDKAFIIRNETGEATRMIGAMQDITKLKENEIHLKVLNENLQVQARALIESNAELEQFAYVASHDLQEPLRMVTSFLSLLQNRYGNLIDGDGERFIHYAVDGATRMRQIILDLLEFSRVGRNIGTLKEVDLNSLAGETAMLFAKQAEENNVSIEIDTLPVLNSYETPLRQVFQNLITNALTYRKQNIPARIKITATELHHHWQFTVEDNGIGIEKEYFDKIFVIFQRLHNKDEYSGTGIGLSITKKIVEALGGKIWLQSEPGVGSSFFFTIRK